MRAASRLLNYVLFAIVAGIEPAAAGFREVAIRPELGPLQHLKATLPHPEGIIQVAYERQGKGLTADVDIPRKLSGWFYWGGTRTALHGGPQHLVF